MRFQIVPLELELGTDPNLPLSDEDWLGDVANRLTAVESLAAVRFFGTGDRLRPIESLGDLASRLGRSRRGGMLVFADHPDPNGDQWTRRVEILITAILRLHYEIRESEVSLSGLAHDAVSLNHVLLAAIAKSEPSPNAIGRLEVPGAEFPGGPPRDLGTVSPWALVDIVHAETTLREPEQSLVHAMRERELPQGATRATDGDLLVVTWGDLAAEPVAEILGRRYAWLVREGKDQ